MKFLLDGLLKTFDSFFVCDILIAIMVILCMYMGMLINVVDLCWGSMGRILHESADVDIVNENHTL